MFDVVVDVLDRRRYCWCLSVFVVVVSFWNCVHDVVVIDVVVVVGPLGLVIVVAVIVVVVC